MAKKIDIRAYSPPTRTLNYSAGDVLSKMRINLEHQRAGQSDGLVTTGILEVEQEDGGFGWAISDYIEFAYRYSSRPIFTWGLDGMPGIEWEDTPEYSDSIPNELMDLNPESYQPAIFVPRIIQWNIQSYVFLGCHILVCQVNPECSETDKIVRIHYRFEGSGYI